MSTVVKTNDLLIFGSHSPFHQVITESGLKETFFRMLIDKNAKIVRKRGFETFLLARKVFPSNTLAINDNIRHGLTEFLLPFVRFGIKNSIDSIYNLKQANYIQGEIALTNELAKVTKVKRVLAMVVDSEKTTLATQKGITTYITRGFSQSIGKTLEIDWGNNFFAFNEPDSLSLLVLIPRQYIANLMLNVADMNIVQATSSLDRDFETLEILRNEMAIDLIKSFFAAFYTDGHRHRINTDIATLNTIFQENGSNMLTSAQDKDDLYTELLKRYRNTLQGFKESDCENVVYECMKLYRHLSHVTINPYMFYNTFIDIPYSHVDMVFKKLPNLVRLSRSSVQTQIAGPDFSNNLSTMDSFFVDNVRDIPIYALKLIRFIPFFLFNTYVVGGGNYHGQALTLLSNVEQFIPCVTNFKSTHLLYGPFTSFLVDELTYLTSTLAKQLNSPLKVNEKSRHMVIDLIANSFASPEEVA
jgi:hypothetical protein